MRRSQQRSSKKLILLYSLVLVLCCAVAGSIAYLTTSSPTVNNSFSPGNVTCEIKESFSEPGTEKKDVSVTNTGNVTAYIRVALVPSWEDGEGNAVAMSADLQDLDITWSSEKWNLGSDGYYYYSEPVEPEAFTELLLSSAKVKADCAGYQAGYRMNLTILAEAIQAKGVDADGKPAVTTAWPVTVADGVLTPRGGEGQ